MYLTGHPTSDSMVVVSFLRMKKSSVSGSVSKINSVYCTRATETLFPRELEFCNRVSRPVDESPLHCTTLYPLFVPTEFAVSLLVVRASRFDLSVSERVRDCGRVKSLESEVPISDPDEADWCGWSCHTGSEEACFVRLGHKNREQIGALLLRHNRSNFRGFGGGDVISVPSRSFLWRILSARVSSRSVFYSESLSTSGLAARGGVWVE